MYCHERQSLNESNQEYENEMKMGCCFYAINLMVNISVIEYTLLRLLKYFEMYCK